MILILMIIDFRSGAHITFSIEPGYYDDVLELEIYGGGHAGNRIYYTLDGSEPNMDSALYDVNMPIVLTDATSNENVYSMRTDTSTGFQYDLVNKYSMNYPGYTVPDHKVDKCNIVRASVLDKNGKCLDTITGVYFIGFKNKPAYEGIYIASIVTDPYNLFDYETGIYTTGIAFDNMKERIPESEDENNMPY